MIEAQRGAKKERNPNPVRLKANTPVGSFGEVRSLAFNARVER